MLTAMLGFNLKSLSAASGSRRWRHAPAHEDHFAFWTGVAYDWSRVIRKHAGHWQQVADIAVHHAKGRFCRGFKDGKLAGRSG
jgi:hypothetical protein